MPESEQAGAVHLDSYERRILIALQADGRLTNEELAKRAGLSPSACALLILGEGHENLTNFAVRLKKAFGSMVPTEKCDDDDIDEDIEDILEELGIELDD